MKPLLIPQKEANPGKRNHDKPYEAISPQRPELSQQGRVVLVSGGSTGIGHAIARNYCIAGASSVIILGRREDVTSAAASKLNDAYPDTLVTSRTCDVFNRAQSQQVWDELEKVGIQIDVLVLNAVGQPVLQPILDQGADRLWQDFENNVHAPLYMVERFYKQPKHVKQKASSVVQSFSIRLTSHSLLFLSQPRTSIVGIVPLRCRATNSPKIHLLRSCNRLLETRPRRRCESFRSTLPLCSRSLLARLGTRKTPCPGLMVRYMLEERF